MREFTKQERKAISLLKPKCNKKEGETFKLTGTRYVKSCVGNLPGHWWDKTDKSLSYEIEITPGDEPCTLNFRISGMVTSFDEASNPVISQQDILLKTVNYSVDRDTEAYDRKEDIPDEETQINDELKAIVSNFFFLAYNLISGYSYLIYGIKLGYRFTGMPNTPVQRHCYDISPEIFMK